MTGLEAAFTAWLEFLASVSVDTDVVLEKPATEQEINKLEHAIGFELPQDLRELYLITNGQQKPGYVEPGQSRYSTNLFGSYDFLSVDEALKAYEFNREIYADVGRNLDEEIRVHSGEPVDALSWKEGWLPIAGSGANQIAIDLAPAEGGDYGQLIPIGADEFERFVLATSLSQFFTTAANETSADECALDYGEPDNSDSHVPEQYRIKRNPYILHITAPWNHPFYRDNCTPEPTYEQPEYVIRSNEVNDRFRDWLLVQGVNQERIDAISMMGGMQLGFMLEAEWREANQQTLELEETIQNTNTEVVSASSESSGTRDIIYLSKLSFDLACQKAGQTAHDFQLLADEYRLFNRFLVVEGIWDERDYQAAEQVMLELPEVEFSGSDDGGVGICSGVRKR